MTVAVAGGADDVFGRPALGADARDEQREPGDEFPLVPRVQANFEAEYATRGWRLALAATYTGRQWLRGDEGNREPGWRLEPRVVVEAAAQREWGRATVFAEVENLLDADYRTFGVLALNRLTDPDAPRVEPFLTPGPPRRILAGVSYRLW